jgi:uncharacterized membrane protein HdeD (DUF308 family)
MWAMSRASDQPNQRLVLIVGLLLIIGGPLSLVFGVRTLDRETALSSIGGWLMLIGGALMIVGGFMGLLRLLRSKRAN